jgi:cell division septation protein DedD
MEHVMRDLDQLEEHDPEQRGSRMGIEVMAGAVALGLGLAVYSAFNQAAGSHSVPEPDPLDQLDRVASAVGRGAATNTDGQVQAGSADPKAEPAIDATKLTFERALSENEERPEVLAALEAAAREEETLAAAHAAADSAPDRLSVIDDVAPLPAAALLEKAERDARDDVPAAPVGREERMRVSMPAGVVASAANGKLAKAARHDQLVAASLPKRSTQPRARVGAEGEYTLQVISFDSAGQAQEFADGLRAKGYEAFVTMSDIDGRGRYYRVRIGPFSTKPQAEAVRHTFETVERMNVIVVKRP